MSWKFVFLRSQSRKIAEEIRRSYHKKSLIRVFLQTIASVLPFPYQVIIESVLEFREVKSELMKEEKGRVGNWNTGKREENEGETDAVQGHSWKNNGE